MTFDFIVIGSGLAGLTSSLVLKGKGTVLLLSKSKLADTATNLAQGGICAVVDKGDSLESHIKDTLVAGAYHNNKKAVFYMVRKAPLAIEWLVKQGVHFDMKNGHFAPTKEAAHSHSRVLHATDFTGQEIEKALVEKIKGEKNIAIWENCFALDLLVEKGRCFGVQVLKTDPAFAGRNLATARRRPAALFDSPPAGGSLRASAFNGKTSFPLSEVEGLASPVFNIFSKLTILATGGLGQIYQWTTNPEIATGDGLAMAERAGANFADLEFVQFHPTALKHGKSPLFLLSEALRGEGAYLIKIKDQSLDKTQDKGSKIKDIKGERFMESYDKRGELAPRDIVARAIFAEQKKGNSVFLDIRHKGKAYLQKRFPNIYKELKTRGFDLTKEPVPVTPAVHYACGGIKVDLYGRTNIKNLFAFGEVACTGAHGSNRLASNSLLEATVFPLRLRKMSIPFVNHFTNSLTLKVAEWHPLGLLSPNKEVGKIEEIKTPRQGRGGGIKKKYRENLQKLMWEKVGIVREMRQMEEALTKIKEWEREMAAVKKINRDFIETKNMLAAARLMTEAALKRRKSLGGHFVV